MKNFFFCVVLILPRLSLVWYSPILLTKSIYAFILSLVYFYGERMPVSEISYSMFGLFLERKTAALKRGVVRDYSRVSQIRMRFLKTKHCKQYYGLPQESP